MKKQDKEEANGKWALNCMELRRTIIISHSMQLGNETDKIKSIAEI
jgi:hypothetical protein